MRKNIDVSIVIVNWNTCDILINCLKSIKQMTQKVSYEVIIVDNNSSDNSCEMITSQFPEFKIIKSSINLGFAKGNNLALESINGKYTFLLNPDTILQYDVISNLYKYIVENKDIGLLVPRLLNEDLTFQSSYASFPSIKELIRYNLTNIVKIPFILTNKLEKLKKTKIKSRDVHWARGAAMIIPTNLFIKLGGFSEDYFMYYEDTDICYRVWELNYRVYYKSDETLVHLYNQSASKVNKFRENNLEIAKEKFLKKYYSSLYFKIYICMELLFLVLINIIYFIFSYNKNIKGILLNNLYRMKILFFKGAKER